MACSSHVTESEESPSQTATPRTAVLLAVALTALWIALGIWRPTTTYHLAPLIVAAMPGAFSGGVRRKRGAALGVTGLVLALFGFLVLAVGPGLDGPTIGPFSSASQETLVLGILGAVAGMISAMIQRDG